MCIVLDNVVQSCPLIRSPIPSGEGVITVGSGGIDEANKLVNLLRYGALPVALQIAQSQTIGPTLGEDSIRASVIATCPPSDQPHRSNTGGNSCTSSTARCSSVYGVTATRPP
jgi:hypothetical protein